MNINHLASEFGLEVKLPSAVSWSHNFTILGPLLQRPTEFFTEVNQNLQLPAKIGSMFVTSVLFLTVYGAVIGSGHPLLSLSAAITIPTLFLGTLAMCTPVMYLLDVVTGSQRSLAQMVAVFLASLTAASTVFFSFAPIMMMFSLTSSLLQFFWLNLGILALATLIGLNHATQGLIETNQVDPQHKLSQVNQRLHFIWMLLFIMVMSQMSWSMLQFFQRTGGILRILF